MRRPSNSLPALALIGDQRAVGKICHAIDELDQAIKDIRGRIFDGSPPAPRFPTKAYVTAPYAGPPESPASYGGWKTTPGA